MGSWCSRIWAMRDILGEGIGDRTVMMTELQKQDRLGPKLLLYLEWPLFGNALLAELIVSRVRVLHDPIDNVVCLLGLGLMRLWLPSRLSHRILYTLVEFSLVLIPCLLGHFRSPLYVFPSLVVVIRSCILFQREIRWLISGIAFGWFVFLQSIHPLPLRFLIPMATRPPAEQLIDPARFEAAFMELRLTSILLYGMILVFVLLSTSALLAEFRSRQELTLVHEQLKRYALKIESQAALQERNRIAREIHDSLGHSLTAQSIQLQNALQLLPNQGEKAERFIQQAFQLGSTALGNIRQSVASLRSDPWRHRSLQGEIITLLQGFHQATGILPESTLEWTSTLSAEICVTLYRLLQEGLTNIAKHSEASQVQICIQQHHDQIHFLLRDNGKGFDPQQNQTGFGLQGMQERVKAVQGVFQLQSQPGQGCEISCWIPIEETV